MTHAPRGCKCPGRLGCVTESDWSDRERDVYELLNAVRGLLDAVELALMSTSPLDGAYARLLAAKHAGETVLGEVAPALPPPGPRWLDVTCMWCPSPGPHVPVARLEANKAVVRCRACRQLFEVNRVAPDRGHAEWRAVEEAAGVVSDLHPAGGPGGPGTAQGLSWGAMYGVPPQGGPAGTPPRPGGGGPPIAQ